MEITRLLTPLFSPRGEPCRPNRTMTPGSVTIHNTANKGADAERHAQAQAAGNLAGMQMAVHYYADDKSIYQCLEDHQQGWHAGDGENKNGGNYTSIAIEVCEHEGIDQRKAFENAARLAAELCVKYGISIVQHKDWRSAKWPSGKDCPHILLNGKDGMDWPWFLGLVVSYLPAPTVDDAAPPAPTPAAPHWAQGSLDRLIDIGIITTPEAWTDFNAPATKAQTLALAERVLAMAHRWIESIQKG
ncbi:MAG: N-acetylmuramoyl-L-alanine amidase [Clostridiales bacterium]|nr:N-acetylmuramoyl-L-alanine amidase [Clostridiales bacterium]